MSSSQFDLIVIGAGPGGYVAAIRGSQLGKKVAIIERENLGGVCLNWGCIPSKSLLKSAETFQDLKDLKDHGIEVSGIKHDFTKVVGRSRKVAQINSKGVEFLMKKNKIQVIMGHATFENSKTLSVKTKDGKTEKLTSEKILVATGARSREIPAFPVDGKRIMGYREAIVQTHQPKSALVIGAGAIGCEFSYVWASFGTNVTLVEAAPRVLPLEEPDSSAVLDGYFKKIGIDIMAGSTVEKCERQETGVKVTLKNKEGKVVTKNVDQVLVSIGVQPNTEDLGLEKIGVKLTDRGFVGVDLKNFQTNVPGVFAIGDVAGPPMLAHKASLEGINCVEKMFGLNPPPIEYHLIPRATYCQPQVASVGWTEEEAKKAGHKIKVGKFPFAASGKARAIGHTLGHVKVITDEKYGEILGTHIVGSDATEMIAEGTLAQRLEATADFIAKTSHAHPTLSEAYLEAIEVALGHGVHV